MQETGERWTELRAQIFGLLAGIDRAASAYEIADMASRANGRAVAPNSIYRILDLFVANNLANRIETTNAYIVNSHPGCVHDCIFLICRDCGSVTHLDDDAVAGQVRDIASAKGFKKLRPVIEVEGFCDACAA